MRLSRYPLGHSPDSPKCKTTRKVSLEWAHGRQSKNNPMNWNSFRSISVDGVLRVNFDVADTSSGTTVEIRSGARRSS